MPAGVKCTSVSRLLLLIMIVKRTILTIFLTIFLIIILVILLTIKMIHAII